MGISILGTRLVWKVSAIIYSVGSSENRTHFPNIVAYLCNKQMISFGSPLIILFTSYGAR